jgi:uncharacterized membrane protein
METVKKFVILSLLMMIFFSLFASGLKDTIKERVDTIHIANEWKVFLISMLPIFELRGAIPMGMHSYKLPLWKVIPISIAGNMVPIFFILLFFDFVTKICFRFPFTKKILEAIFARTRSKSAVIEKYEEIGLMFFVAIPLPITGAWTGSLAAYLFGLPFWKSILFIFLGVCIASVVVSSLSYLKWFGLAIAVVALILIFINNKLRKRKKTYA